MAECHSYAAFCELLSIQDETAKLLLRLQHTFMRTCELDPLNGAGLSLDLDAFLQRICDCSAEPPSAERLERIMRHCGDALRNILANPQEILMREYAMLPLQSVREVDTVTLAWLNPKPGRTIRQKMSSSRNLLAPRRRWSMDTLENRLVKKFLQVLLERMSLRAGAIGGDALDELENWHNISSRWLHREETAEIGAWTNTAPNNILLSHKFYRKVWDAWNWLRALDERISNDFGEFPSRIMGSFFWRFAAMLAQKAGYRLLQCPVLFDVDSMSACIAGQQPGEQSILGRQCVRGSWHALRLELKDKKFTYSVDNREVISAKIHDGGIMVHMGDKDYSCSTENSFLSLCPLKPNREDSECPPLGNTCVVDFCELQPWYRIDDGKSTQLPFRLLAETPQEGSGLLDLGRARAFVLDKDYPPVSFADIFNRSLPDEYLIAAAQFFFERLREYLRNTGVTRLVAIIPDNLNEFQLSIFHKYLRLYFPLSVTLPASVAAAFKFRKNTGGMLDGMDHVLLVIFNVLGEKLVLTPLEGNRDEALALAVPESLGLVWFRHPSREIPFTKDILQNVLHASDIHLPFMPFTPRGLVSLAGNASIFSRKNGEYGASFDLPPELAAAIEGKYAEAPLGCAEEYKKIVSGICGDKKIPVYAVPTCKLRVRLPDARLCPPVRLVSGAAMYAQWSQTAPKQTFWKDHLPDLYMRVSGMIQPVPLARNVTILPIPGEKVPIPVHMEIELPADKAVCQFPLQREESGSRIRFIGQLESRRYLPVNHNWRARLELSYEYGAENPFDLVLVPQDKDMPEKLHVQWLPEAKMRRDSPAPPFLPENDWNDLKSFEGKKGIVNAYKELCGMWETVHQIRLFLDRDAEGPRKRIYYENFGNSVRWVRDEFTFLKVSGFSHDVFLHKSNFFDREGNSICPLDAESISFDVVAAPNNPDRLKAINVTEGFSFRIPSPGFGSAMRFFTQLIWNFGRSLGDAEAPPELREAAMRFFDDMQWLRDFDDENLVPWQFVASLERAAKRMHKDAPAHIWEIMEDQLDKNKWSAWETGYALGKLDTQRQKDMFDAILEASCRPNGNVFAALSRAFWRHKSLVYTLSPAQARDLAGNLLNFMRNLLNKLKITPKDMDPKIFGDYDRNFLSICEVFLALLRTRESENTELAAILDSNGELADEFRGEFERLINAQQDFGFKMKSDLLLEVKKEGTSVPDILYAADLYLNGDARASDIRIISFSEEEDYIS